MASSSTHLQQSVHAALTADPAIIGLLGAPNVFDDVPRAARHPYITIGQSLVKDWSTGTEEGDEHILTLHVWSRAKGRQETHEIMAAVRAALADAPLSLTGHRLVNLRHEFSEARRDPDGETYHGLVRLRAVTEPID